MHNQPLKDIKVIELSGIGPTPYAGQLLADLGAEVIRIERPGAFKLPVENRGKTGIELDLKTDAGRMTGWGQSALGRTKQATTSIISVLQARYMQWGKTTAHQHYL